MRFSKKIRIEVIWILIAVTSLSLAMACAKQAARSAQCDGPICLFYNPWFAGMIGAHLVQAISWVMALRTFPLSVAYPFVSLTYVFNLSAATWIFGEQINATQLAGIGIAALGVAIIGRRSES